MEYNLEFSPRNCPPSTALTSILMLGVHAYNKKNKCGFMFNDLKITQREPSETAARDFVLKLKDMVREVIDVELSRHESQHVHEKSKQNYGY